MSKNPPASLTTQNMPDRAFLNGGQIRMFIPHGRPVGASVLVLAFASVTVIYERAMFHKQTVTERAHDMTKR